MTPPDEVVCESEARFIYEVRKHVDYYPGGKVMPGDSVTVGGRTIVYRPKPPERCPRCGSESRCHYIHSVCPPRPEFRAACFCDGDYHPWHVAGPITDVKVRFATSPLPKPPPPIGCLRDEHIDALRRDGRFVLNGETILYEATPRDAAREAFEEWFGQFVYPGDLRSDLRAAFLAGRASVKP